MPIATAVECHMLLQLWDRAQKLPLPAMSRDAPENSPIFFLHGVGFGLVSPCSFLMNTQGHHWLVRGQPLD